MTEQTQVVAPDGAGNPSVPEGTGQGSAPDSPSFLEQFSEDYREAIGKSGFKDLNDLAKGFVNANSTIQSTQRFPGSDDPEKLQAFFAKIGPESADAYAAPDLSALPEDTPFDQEMFDGFRDIAHKHNILPHQFDGMIKDYLPLVQQADARAHEALGQKADNAASEVAEKFGGKDSEAYNAAMSQVNALYEQNADVKTYLQGLGAITEDGEVRDANAFFLLHALSGATGTGGAAKVEGLQKAAPGDTGIDPETGNITDPIKAAAFREADPEGYERALGRLK